MRTTIQFCFLQSAVYLTDEPGRRLIRELLTRGMQRREEVGEEDEDRAGGGEGERVV